MDRLSGLGDNCSDIVDKKKLAIGYNWLSK